MISALPEPYRRSAHQMRVLLRTARTWPAGADGLVTRFDGLPDLYWLRLVGPTTIMAISAIMTISTSLA
ncbi:hypothetical protein AB0K40_27805 [Nonomuraea bangladeshensis]|uniref:ABC transporter permease n=1 Tax=Nonomuraea bangladeshensis TaxID=404385 RepID=A0ABV3H9X0_9ACTN